MRIRLLFIGITTALLAIGCSSAPVRDIGLDKLAPRKAEKELSEGLKNYENGRYQIAATNLTSALNNGLTFKRDQVTAHKYLAFIYCVSDRKKQCREQFKKALQIDPGLKLTPAEAGHPIWAPIFREMQSKY